MNPDPFNSDPFNSLKLDLLRSLEQQYAGLRARLVEFERRPEQHGDKETY